MRKWKIIILVVFGLITILSATSFAEDGAQQAGGAKGLLALGAGLAIGLAACGGGIGQGIAAGSSQQGISRNPGAADKMFVPFIIGLALIESLVLYAFVIAILLQGKI